MLLRRIILLAASAALITTVLAIGNGLAFASNGVGVQESCVAPSAESRCGQENTKSGPPGAPTRTIQANFGDEMSHQMTTEGGPTAKELRVQNPYLGDGSSSITCGSEPGGPPCTK